MAVEGMSHMLNAMHVLGCFSTSKNGYSKKHQKSNKTTKANTSNMSKTKVCFYTVLMTLRMQMPTNTKHISTDEWRAGIILLPCGHLHCNDFFCYCAASLSSFVSSLKYSLTLMPVTLYLQQAFQPYKSFHLKS